MAGKNITAWNGFIEFELDRIGVPKLGHAFISINETITEKFNTTKTVLKETKATPPPAEEKTEELEIQKEEEANEEKGSSSDKKDNTEENTLQKEEEIVEQNDQDKKPEEKVAEGEGKAGE